MPQLHCYLERGFSGEEVEVILGQTELFRGPATTDLMMGFARELTGHLTSGEPNLLEVRLPVLGLTHRTLLPQAAGPLWARVRLEGGRLMVLVDTEPLGFL